MVNHEIFWQNDYLKYKYILVMFVISYEMNIVPLYDFVDNTFC